MNTSLGTDQLHHVQADPNFEDPLRLPSYETPEMRARIALHMEQFSRWSQGLPLLYDPDEPKTDESLWNLPNGARIGRILRWYEEGHLEPQALKALLAWHWTNGGYAGSLGVRRVVRMFKYAGYVTDVPDLSAPTRPIPIYRGAGVGFEYGLSWTTDERIAAWFACRIHRFRPDLYGGVICTTLPPKHVLGMFSPDHEAEVVVNPLGIRDRWSPGSRTFATDRRIQDLADEWMALRGEKSEASLAATPDQDIATP